MKILQETIENFKISYDLGKIAPLEKVLFLDIETTGFTARSSNLYLIGCAFYKYGYWHTIQWFAENYRQEKDLLHAFFEFASNYEYLIHFNGNNFDLPYLTQKCIQLGLPYSFEKLNGIDLYRRISPYKYFLKLSNCKQKTIELFLGIDRKTAFPGSELISIYQEYVDHPSEFSEKSLLLHNADDLRGMLEILPILAYYDLFNEPVRAKKVQANYYKDYGGDRRKELLISLTLPSPLPKAVSASSNECYFKGEGEEAILRIPIYEEELKYFYANYHDYYYLPAEDIALHKSVATFVEKNHRIQASASNCYTRKFSTYLPQWDVIFKPFFKRDYKSNELYFELTDEIKKNRQIFTDYANHVLTKLAATY